MTGLKDKHWTHPAMQVFRKGLLREQRLQSFFAGCALLTGCAAVLFLWPSIPAYIGLVVSIVSVRWILLIRPWAPATHAPVARMLCDHPERIVWVYGVETQMSPYGFRFARKGILYFKLEDGKEFSLPLPPDKLKLVSRFLNRILPHASFGYDAEKDRLFRQAPKKLRRQQ